MNENVHSEVEQGDLLKQLEAVASGQTITYDQIRYLNKHNAKHVEMVIEKASVLLQELHAELSPFEGFLLLLAIHFHDVGIVYGREEHEIKCQKLMQMPQIEGRLPDATLRSDIIKIASVHGGVCSDGDKDTISTAITESVCHRYGQIVRRRFLAAIVRFADELADDRTRASVLKIGDEDLPSISMLHHCYSDSLHSVSVESNTVKLDYRIGYDVAIRKFKTPKRDVYLLDEIYSRTKKMHQERIYCMRFWPHEYQQIRDIQVDICVELVPQGYLADEELISYHLAEEGYPGLPAGDCRLCLKTDILRTGEEMATYIAERNSKASEPIEVS